MTRDPADQIQVQPYMLVGNLLALCAVRIEEGGAPVAVIPCTSPEGLHLEFEVTVTMRPLGIH